MIIKSARKISVLNIYAHNTGFKVHDVNTNLFRWGIVKSTT